MFADSKRPIFKKGMTNGFLMAVPKQVIICNFQELCSIFILILPIKDINFYFFGKR